MDAHREIGPLESISVTTSTDLFRGEARDTLEIGIVGAIGFDKSTFQIRNDSLILRPVHLPIVMLGDIRYLERSWYTIEDFLFVFFGEFFPWSIDIDSLTLAHSIEQERIIWVVLPRKYCSLGEGKVRTGDI
jgi:hypothetical protein